jgi:hypothetical protein
MSCDPEHDGMECDVRYGPNTCCNYSAGDCSVCNVVTTYTCNGYVCTQKSMNTDVGHSQSLMACGACVVTPTPTTIPTTIPTTPPGSCTCYSGGTCCRSCESVADGTCTCAGPAWDSPNSCIYDVAGDCAAQGLKECVNCSHNVADDNCAERNKRAWSAQCCGGSLDVSCNDAEITLSVSPNPVNVGDDVNLIITGDASMYISDNWSDTFKTNNILTETTDNPGMCGGTVACCPGDRIWPAYETCFAVKPPAGTYTWFHFWKHCHSATNCSGVCSKSVNSTVNEPRGTILGRVANKAKIDAGIADNLIENPEIDNCGTKVNEVADVSISFAGGEHRWQRQNREFVLIRFRLTAKV